MRPTYKEIEIVTWTAGVREVATVELTVWPGRPAYVSGLPEDCYDREPGEWEIDRLVLWSDETETERELSADELYRWELEHGDAVHERCVREGWV